MKFLCDKCDTHMRYHAHKQVAQGSIRIIFECPQCGTRVSMLTNPGETQLVHSLGVSIGVGATQHLPLELTRSTLVEKRPIETEGERLPWTEEAERRFDNVPAPFRPMARKAVENYARERGYSEITSKVIDESKERWGAKPSSS